MTLSLQPLDSTRTCGICLNDIEGQGFVHSGENGKKHPFHEECISSWINHSSTRSAPCPACKFPLQSTTERVKWVARLVATVALLAGITLVGSIYKEEIASMPPSLPGMPIFINIGEGSRWELPVVPFLVWGGLMTVISPVILKLTKEG